MMKPIWYFLIFCLIASCVEPYEFVLHDNQPSLVIEASISDKSYNETLLYPSDGRYFTVKLSTTSDVINTRSEPVNGAVVQLLSSEGDSYVYDFTSAGVYTLFDGDFRARRGVTYKLRITLAADDIYESAWEALPGGDAGPIGDVGFQEKEKQMYIMEAGEWVLRTRKIISVGIQVPGNSTGQPLRYRWTYSPMWIYTAPLASSVSDGYRCWVTNQGYLNTYALQEDRSGGYTKELFDMLTVRNERLYEKFSLLVTQHALTEDYYDFWKEMKSRNEGSALLDVPPFNLRSNFTSTTGEKKVFGYFGVTAEQATRWYFDKTELSYYVDNTLRADCLVSYGPGPPAEECTDCRFYSFGQATAVKPSWWGM